RNVTRLPGPSPIESRRLLVEVGTDEVSGTRRVDRGPGGGRDALIDRPHTAVTHGNRQRLERGVGDGTFDVIERRLDLEIRVHIVLWGPDVLITAPVVVERPIIVVRPISGPEIPIARVVPLAEIPNPVIRPPFPGVIAATVSIREKDRVGRSVHDLL